MKMDEIVTLMEAVSKYGMTSFELEEGGTRLVLEKKAEQALAIKPSAADFVGDQAEEMKPASADFGTVVVSPLVGTFYSASSPEAEPFVKAGDSVKKGQVLGIIEAMKLMNEIEAECDGVVDEIFVQNEQMVEYGQPLFRIR